MKLLKSTFERRFVEHTMMIALPIMLQNGITNFVNMLDNIMVGRIGTDPMTGVSIVNSLLFVWNLCLFGGLSGIGIFTAQYCGKEDDEGVRRTFRLQIILAILLVAAGIAVFVNFGESLIGLYLHEDSGGGSVEATMSAALQYLSVMCVGFLPLSLTMVYYTTIRSYGETVAPMIASFISVGVNLVGNYVLIFGKFGAPKLGVVGAAMATVIARFVELAYIVGWAHTHAARVPFVEGALRSKARCGACMCRQSLRSAASKKACRSFSMKRFGPAGRRHSRSATVCAGCRLSHPSTFRRRLRISLMSLLSRWDRIIIGQKLGELGESHPDELKDEAWRLTIFSVFLCVISAVLMISTSAFFPKIYNTSDEIRALATRLICVAACFMPFHAFNNAAYFIIRSGGKTWITFLFDSCFCWVASIPAAYFLAHYTQVPIVQMFALVSAIEMIKVAIGWRLVKTGFWIRDITV